MAQLTGKRSLIAGILAAIGASLCCAGPLVLVALGIGGTWVGSLTAMEPHRPDADLPRLGLPQALSGASGLYTGHALR